MGFGVSIFFIAAGAILAWAVNDTWSAVNLHTVGVILLVVGLIGLVVSMFVSGGWANGGTTRYRRRERYADGPDRDVVVEERRDRW